MNIKKASKQRLLNKLAEETKMGPVETQFVWHKLLDIIKEELKSGSEVYMPGIGKFYLYERGPSKSNLTNQYIPRHYQLKFKPNQTLARYIRVMSRET